MIAKTSRMMQIEEMLAADPNDPELRYFLAMELLSAGEEQAGAAKLCEITAESNYVPAFLQAGQVLAKLGRISDACAALRKGIDQATKQGNDHASGEMQSLLDSIE